MSRAPRTCLLGGSLLSCLVCSALALADEPAVPNEVRVTETIVAPAADSVAQTPSYGPDKSVSRGTLFQWSYGTSFTGGPNLDEPLVTDRPDFTEASSTVGLGITQLEMGYTFRHDSDVDATVRSHSMGEPLLRYGVFADWLEFRVGLFPISEHVRLGGTSVNHAGTEDLYLGFKIGLTPQEGKLPEMALIPQMSLPTGSRAFTNNELLPGANWIYAWEIREGLAIAGSTQANRKLDDATGRAYWRIDQTATIGFDLSESLAAYTEWFAFFPTCAQSAQVEHYLDGGFAYRLSNDVQFDVRAGMGLTRASDDFFTGVGLSMRFR